MLLLPSLRSAFTAAIYDHNRVNTWNHFSVGLALKLMFIVYQSLPVFTHYPEQNSICCGLETNKDLKRKAGKFLRCFFDISFFLKF